MIQYFSGFLKNSDGLGWSNIFSCRLSEKQQQRIIQNDSLEYPLSQK